jgi:hypothetical protein
MNAILLLSLILGPAQTAQLACPEPVVDRGTVRGGPVLKQSFTLTNRGDSAVQILETRGSCGCLKPKLSSNNLKPGETTTLELEVGTLSQPEGQNIWSVYLKCRCVGSETEQVVRVQVKANVERELAVEPAALRLFGSPGLAHEITLIDRRPNPLTISTIRTTSPRVLAEWSGPWQRASTGWQRKLLVQLADGPDGKLDEVVQLFSDDPDYREISIRVSGALRSKRRYVISPDEVKLQAASEGSTSSFLILIRSADGRPVEIGKAECTDPAITCCFADGTWPTATVRVQVNKDQIPARQSVLHVQVLQPAAQTLEIPVHADADGR